AAAAALAGYAAGVAGQASARLQTVEGEAAAARWLDAEEATMRQVLAWAMEHDTSVALRLTVALAPWWLLRARLAGRGPLLRQVGERAEPGSREWCAAQFWLGRTARFSVIWSGRWTTSPRSATPSGPGIAADAGRGPDRPVLGIAGAGPD